MARHPATGEGAIIAEKGLYAADRRIKISQDDKQHLFSADKLLNTGLSYEIFSYKILA